MHKILIAVVTITLLTAGFSFAVDYHQMHNEMMQKQGGPTTDGRTELRHIPAPMKIMHKAMMRQHLDHVSQITAALAANDLNKAAEIAVTNLGWSQERAQECSVFEPVKSGSDYTTLAAAMHKKADELADAAKSGYRDKAFQALAELIHNCNECHKKFKH
ncbi:MAG: cytochrome c [Candidatus Methylomirabilis oxygeniifera]|uniref:Cytochrome c n=1 Tax=Methylomirabilis oxygeniifera TaxID=671143 RepID=D5MGX2_METO1|nr:MAG: cytochrome c [Candidatus Methylomirabilis oxyfera]CBE69003.1 exported protein of unknown function [Candidatus Methylomirabilis oxyfera]